MKTNTIKKILTEAKEKNLTWNFSTEGQYYYPEDINPGVRTNDVKDSIKEENLGATDEVEIVFNTGEWILYMPYEEDTEVCNYSGSLNWIHKYL